MSNPVQAIYDMLNAKALVESAAWKAPKIRFRPSEIGGCWREMFYRLSGNQPGPLSSRSALLFLDGDMHHNVVRQLMQQAGVELGDLVFEADGGVTETNSTIRTIQFEHGGTLRDVTISTRTDGAVAPAPGLPMMVLELKSVGKYKFEGFATAFLKGGQEGVVTLLKDQAIKKAGARPAPLHANRRFWLQFQATLLAVDKPAMYVVLKNRDTGEIGLPDKNGVRHGFVVAADIEAQQEVLQRCSVVLAALEAGKAPSTEFVDGSTSCGMCNFYNLCWGAVKKS